MQQQQQQHGFPQQPGMPQAIPQQPAQFPSIVPVSNCVQLKNMFNPLECVALLLSFYDLKKRKEF